MADSRRGFLKLFGAGASVVPLLAGKPIIEATAKLIEQPKVELVQGFTHPAEFESTLFGEGRAFQMSVLFMREDGIKVAVLAPKSVVQMVEREEIYPIYDLTGRPGDIRGGSVRSVKWRMEGECFEDSKGKLLDFYEIH